MPRAFRNADYFTSRDVTPSSLQQDNLVSFSYQSPNGVHDPQPLVYVLEKQLDRMYGINLHYDMAEMQELLEMADAKVKGAIEREWYRKNPAKRQELRENRIPFSTTLIEEKELRELVRRIPTRDLEQYILSNVHMFAFRCYLYKRMNRVAKLIWRTDIKVLPGAKNQPVNVDDDDSSYELATTTPKKQVATKPGTVSSKPASKPATGKKPAKQAPKKQQPAPKPRIQTNQPNKQDRKINIKPNDNKKIGK